MTSKQLISSKLTIAILVISLGFLANVKFRQWRTQQAINREKQNLTLQAEAISRKNQELNQSLAHLSSGDFKERIARQQLGLKKEGEVVFDFTTGNGQQAGEGADDGRMPGRTNFQKWWAYFTGSTANF